MKVQRLFIWLALILPTTGYAQISKAQVERELLNYESVPAVWHHLLSSTKLVGYRENEELVISSISTGTIGRDVVVRHNLTVKVDQWGKRFTTVYESPDKRNKETFSVTLYPTDDSRTLRAEFDHTVFENGHQQLRFCGTTTIVK